MPITKSSLTLTAVAFAALLAMSDYLSGPCRSDLTADQISERIEQQ